MTATAAMTSDDDYYDGLDMPFSSFTNRIEDPKTFDDYVTFLQLSNTIKEALVKQTKYETSAFLLRCLRAIINEQVEAKLLSRSQGDTIYEFVESMAIDRGYAAW